MTVDEGRKATLRGRLVEAVRLIFVAVFGAVGYQLGTYATATTGGRAILYVFLGAASGYVCGGVFGRLTLEAVRGLEEEFSRRPAAAGRRWGHRSGDRARGRHLAVLAAPVHPGDPGVAGGVVRVPRAGFAGAPAGSGQVRGHLRSVRHEAASDRARRG